MRKGAIEVSCRDAKYCVSADLREAFPDMKGLSPRNLFFMRSFAEAYPDRQIVKQVVSQLPWGHNIRFYLRGFKFAT
jgi:hypothetical protein